MRETERSNRTVRTGEGTKDTVPESGWGGEFERGSGQGSPGRHRPRRGRKPAQGLDALVLVT